MADNYTATAGSGLTFAADDVSSVLYPRIKIAHGADGSASDVSTASPLPVGGPAADDAAAAGNPLSVGGLYQSTPNLVDDGDIGRLRMTVRRALMHAADYSFLALYGTTPNPSGSDILTSLGATPVTGDFHVRDTDYHGLIIPLAAANWRKISVQISTQEQAFDQQLGMDFFAYHTDWYNALLATVTIPTSALYFSLGEGAVGQGGLAGTGTPASTAWYNVPAFNAGLPYLYIRWKAAGVPTTGKLAVLISRSS